MNQDQTVDTSVLEQINAVEGFDPRPFAVDYTDLGTGQTRKRLPVMIQMAWFRLRYPEGKISVEVTQGHDCFVAKARVYPNYRDPVECYLAEATASRGRCQDKPSVSPREWAQTAAVGIALRNAGFGLQFSAAGEDFSSTAPDEFTMDLVRRRSWKPPCVCPAPSRSSAARRWAIWCPSIRSLLSGLPTSIRTPRRSPRRRSSSVKAP